MTDRKSKQLGDSIPAGNRLELFLGAAIGAITFSGSVIAFGKLSGKYKFRLFQGAPVQGLATLGLGLTFMFTGNLTAFALMLALAFVLGVLIIIPIGGADMPAAPTCRWWCRCSTAIPAGRRRGSASR